ncbi:MAG: hypothetical protein AB7I30_15715 [Isosphaeraceae bacterium]
MSGLFHKKPEWKKDKYKTGKVIIVNKALGTHAPNGQAIKVSWTQGFKKESTVLALGKSVTIEQTSEKLEIVCRAMLLPDMAKTTLTVHGKQYYDHLVNVCESSRLYGLTMAGGPLH